MIDIHWQLTSPEELPTQTKGQLFIFTNGPADNKGPLQEEPSTTRTKRLICFRYLHIKFKTISYWIEDWTGKKLGIFSIYVSK